MIIVIINGVGGSGKDKFIKIFTEIHNKKVLNISTVDQVKNISRTVFGWDGIKDEKSRKLLSELKRVWSDYNNGPFNYTVNKIKEFELSNKDPKDSVVFIHCREPEEIDKFKDFFKGYNFNTLLVERDVPIPDNKSDCSVFDYKYDYYIENDEDIDSLTIKVKKFHKDLLNK